MTNPKERMDPWEEALSCYEFFADEIVTVKTEIVQDGAQPIKVNYALAKNGDSWLVFDIVIEGVSLVTNYRSQFSSEIRKGGMDSLNKKLANKNKSNKD